MTAGTVRTGGFPTGYPQLPPPGQPGKNGTEPGPWLNWWACQTLPASWVDHMPEPSVTTAGLLGAAVIAVIGGIRVE